MTKTLTLEQRLQALARETAECPCQTGESYCSHCDHHAACGQNCRCGGTRKVLRWEGLTAECTGSSRIFADDFAVCQGKPNCRCCGTRRILLRNTKLLQGLRASIGDHDYQKSRGVHKYRPHGMRDYFYSRDELEAATQALEALAKETK